MLTLSSLSGPAPMFGWTDGGRRMAKRRHTAEEIIGKLREPEVLLVQGRSVAHAAKAVGVTERSYDRW